MRNILFFPGMFLFVLSQSPVFPDVNDALLKVSSPAYLPYAGDFFFRNDWTYENTSSRTEFPMQTLPNSTVWPAATISAPKTEYYTELSFKYGLTDRVSLGAGGRYMLRSQAETKYEGGAGLPASTSTEGNGLYQPTVAATFRLLGARSNEWYLNVEGRFQPGMSSGPAFASAQNTFVGLAGGGWNSGDFTCMLALYGGYSAAKSVNGINYAERDIAGGQLMMQFDFEDFYLRPVGGFMKFFDSTSESNPILRQIQPFVKGEVGFFVGEDTVLSAAVEQKLPLSAAVSTNGLSGKSYYEGMLTVSLSLSSVF